MSATSQNKTRGLGHKESDKTKKRDRLASEERLMKAAEEIFSKFGFKGATTRLIAKKACINESLIGRYFDGKLGLLLSIIQKHVKDFHNQALHYPPQETVTLEIQHFIQQRFERNCRKNLDFFKIVVSQCLVDVKFNKKIRESIPFSQEPYFVERLEALMKGGKMRKCNPENIVRDLEAEIFGTILLFVVLRGVPEQEAYQWLRNFGSTYARAYETQG